MWSFGALCDEFCVAVRLHLKLDLDPTRETILHFFEQIRRAEPRLSRLRRRDDGCIVLDEPDEGEGRRYVRLDPGALKFGAYDATESQVLSKLGKRVLTLAPAQLSLSDLDYDYLEVMFSFDLEYRGNHDALIAETFFAGNPLLAAIEETENGVIECQPLFGVRLDPECESQAYIEIKGRTSTYEVRTGDYETSPITLSLTLRRYWAGQPSEDLLPVFRDLLQTSDRIAQDRVVPLVVQPLAAAIASRR